MTQDFESPQWQQMIRSVLEVSRQASERRTARLAAMTESELALSFVTAAALSDPKKALESLELAVSRPSFSAQALAGALRAIPRERWERIIAARMERGVVPETVARLLRGLTDDEVQRLGAVCILPPGTSALALFLDQHLPPERPRDVGRTLRGSG